MEVHETMQVFVFQPLCSPQIAGDAEEQVRVAQLMAEVHAEDVEYIDAAVEHGWSAVLSSIPDYLRAVVSSELRDTFMQERYYPIVAEVIAARKAKELAIPEAPDAAEHADSSLREEPRAGAAAAIGNPAVWCLTAETVAPLLRKGVQLRSYGRLQCDSGVNAPVVSQSLLDEEEYVGLTTCPDGACGLHAFLGRPHGARGQVYWENGRAAAAAAVKELLAGGSAGGVAHGWKQ